MSLAPHRQTNLHDLSAADFLAQLQIPADNLAPDPVSQPTSSQPADILINSASSTPTISPADIRRVLSSAKAASTPSSSSGDITINGTTYTRKINTALTYRISEHKHSHNASLVDRGANGGIAGNDVRVTPSMSTESNRTVNIQGIDNHQLTAIPLVSVGGVSQSQSGPVILIFHQYAHYGKNKSIHSPVQLESFHNTVNDRSIKLNGGGQFIKTNDGYHFPLDIYEGLPYLPLRPFTDKE